MKMPIIRKIIQVGSSKAVSIPISWLKFYEEQNGCEIKKVAMEVNDVLTIRPILPKDGGKRNTDK